MWKVDTYDLIRASSTGLISADEQTGRKVGSTQPG